MRDDLGGKTLAELKELHQQLTHEIDVMEQMRVRQIDIAVNAAGDAARELTSERRVAIHADVNSRFLPSLNDLNNRLVACQTRIDRLTQNKSTVG